MALSRVIRATVDVQLGLSVTADTMSARVQLSGCEQCNEKLSCYRPLTCVMQVDELFRGCAKQLPCM